MDEKKLQKEQEKEKNQGVLELIEDSLGDVSGGVYNFKAANIDDNKHWHKSQEGK